MEQNQTTFNQPAAAGQPPMNPSVSQSQIRSNFWIATTIWATGILGLFLAAVGLSLLSGFLLIFISIPEYILTVFSGIIYFLVTLYAFRSAIKYVLSKTPVDSGNFLRIAAIVSVSGLVAFLLLFAFYAIFLDIWLVSFNIITKVFFGGIFYFLATLYMLKHLSSPQKDDRRLLYACLAVWFIMMLIIVLFEIFLPKEHLAKKHLAPGDDSIMAALSLIRTQAKLYFDYNSSSYIGVDDWDRNPGMKDIVEEVAVNGGQIKWGMITPQSYVVWSPLISKPELFYCVDSTGDACKLNREPEGGERVAIRCGCPIETAD